MTKERSPAANLFAVKKKFSWKSRLITFLEVGLIAIVLIGTGIWLLIAAHFSFSDFFSAQLKKLQPQVNVEKKIRGQTSEEQIKTLLKNVVEVVSVTKIGTDYLDVRSQDNLEMLFSLSKDLSGQVTTLQTLLAKAKMDNRSLKKADFRFEKIVVEYN